MQFAVVVTVELHEHEVPDFDVAISIGVRRAGRAARDLRPMVVEDLAAGPAGTRLAHLPEVVGTAARLVADTGDALARHADLIGPQVVCLVIRLVDGDPQFFLRQLVNPGEQFPCVVDRVALEIIAERKIAQHLEKRVVARGIADIFQVVVLAARAHATLRRGSPLVGPLLLAEKYILELHHPRVGEEQRRIVAGDERARGNDRVALGFEILEKLLADFAAVHDSTPDRLSFIHHHRPRT